MSKFLSFKKIDWASFPQKGGLQNNKIFLFKVKFINALSPL